MRRVCKWCGQIWEASRIDPPEHEPYFCPIHADKQRVWEALRGGREHEQAQR